MKRCFYYCGTTCINGNCPLAMREEYAERGYDTPTDCRACPYYKGCEDCLYADNCKSKRRQK